MTRRPVGVVFVAILLALGTLFLVLFAFGSGVMAIVAPHMAIPSNGVTPPPPQAMIVASMIFSTLLYLVCAGWSGTTLVGLIRMRPWARISMIVIGAAFIFFGLMGVLGVFVAQAALPTMPLPPNANPGALHAAFAFMMIFSFALVVVGTWWVVYFALRNTREAFRNAQVMRAGQTTYPQYAHPLAARQTGPLTDFSVAQPLSQHDSGVSPQGEHVVVEPVAGEWPQTNKYGQPLEPMVAEPVVTHGKRPVSMTVVAVLLLIGSFLALIQMASPTPLFFMSVVLAGWPAHLTMLMLCAVSGVSGLGILKLQKPAWMLAVGLFCIYIVNGLTLLLPGGRERYGNYMHVVMSRASMGMPLFSFDPRMLFVFAIVGAFFAVAFGCTMLFLLWRARLSFETAADDQAAA